MRASFALNEDVATNGFSTPIGGGCFAAQIAKEARPAHLLDASLSPAVTNGWLRSRGTRGLYGVPLVWDGTVIGVALLGSRIESVFTEAEKRLFIAMAERAAWAVAKHGERTQLYDALAAAPAVVIATRGPGHRCEFLNAAATALFGGRDLAGRTAASVLGAANVRVLDEVWATGAPCAREELAVIADFRGDGAQGERYFHLTATPLRNGSTAAMERILTYATDVTAGVKARREREALQTERLQLLERERSARAEAEKANRAKDEFLATVSHELRTPLNAIMGWAATARMKAPPDVERALAIIERNARAQARIIEDVLDISRIARGKLLLERRTVQGEDALTLAAESVKSAADGKGVQLTTEIGALGMVYSDPERVQQIVWNLLMNAIKFTPKGGNISLRAKRHGRLVAIHVADDGPGIDPAFLPHLFEPFRQADGSTTRRHGGLGLGLAIVRRLVDAHGGRVFARSDGIGEGASFTVELPIGVDTASAGEVAARAGGAAATRGLDGIKVVVVDDDDDARMLVRDVLGGRGALVETAATVDEALEKVRGHAPHVLVSDIGMPNADGYALVRRLRSLPPELGGRTPAIALTAYARPQDSADALAAGFQRHVPKPVDLDALAVAVAEIAKTPRCAG
jgi:signal transduction histidine kinase/ActR/RegA family two-component response regulator